MRDLATVEVGLVGVSEAIRLVDADITTAARSDAKVLITGETGVGKDVAARLIHARSARGAAPLATVNCAGFPDALLESELFGHVRGSFTGAFRDKPGLFEAAHQSTAFLDEAGEMSLRMQAVLLRFLETGELQRVGADRSVRRVNVRVIAATNRDLRAHVAAGAFREDLYYRLNVIRIHVPPLRDRPDDVPVLFEHFLDEASRAYRLDRRTLTTEATGALRAYSWPGNVRELKNVVERLAVKAPGAPIAAADLPEECRAAAPAPVVKVMTEVSARAAVDALLSRMLDRGESFWTVVHEPFMGRDLSREQLRTIVRAGLEQTAGNYRLLVELFNMPTRDYKRFLAFLRKHECHVPFHAFRVVPIRRSLALAHPQPGTAPYSHASGL